MHDILHRIGVKDAEPARVYAALTTIAGLAGWWTTDTTGGTDPGQVIEFRFPLGGFDMEVVESVPDKRVTWKVVGGPAEWIGTTIGWDLRDEGEHTIVLLKHEGWKEQVEFMHHCSTKWGSYLISLKELVETGRGRPAPHDERVGDYD